MQRSEISQRKGKEKEKKKIAELYDSIKYAVSFTFSFSNASFTIMSLSTEACLRFRSGVSSGCGFWPRASSNPLDIML